jgi:membrane protein implicated in regulation of membrane protease activity
MLNYFREAQEARFATPARRIYGYVSAGIVVAVMAIVIAGLAPLWISWTTFAASCVLDAVLTRNWISEDALRAYRGEYPG